MTDHEDSLRNRWSRGDFADHPWGPTVVLAALLAVTVLAAGVLVLARSKHLDAERRAAQLIEEVARDGLITYLGSEPIARYYLLTRSGKVIGYATTRVAPVFPQPDTPVFTCRELTVRLSEYRRIESELVIANDLSRYEMIEQSRELLSGKITTGRQMFRNGVLALATRRGEQKLKPARHLRVNNLVPSPLVDFFTSLSVARGPSSSEVIAFGTLIAIEQEHGQIFRLLKLRVLPQDNTPAKLEERFGQLSGATVEWPQQVSSQTQEPFTQNIYYDSLHQLVWQKSLLPEPEIRRAVTHEELIQAYPEAQQVLQRWQRTEDDEPNDGHPSLEGF